MEPCYGKAECHIAKLEDPGSICRIKVDSAGGIVSENVETIKNTPSGKLIFV